MNRCARYAVPRLPKGPCTAGRAGRPPRTSGGHDVRTVPSLAEAQALFGDAAFDAVLVDYDLDDGKGDAFVRHLVAQRFAGRIIGISSHDDGNRGLLAAGAHAPCPKARFKEISSLLEHKP